MTDHSHAPLAAFLLAWATADPDFVSDHCQRGRHHLCYLVVAGSRCRCDCDHPHLRRS